MKNIFPVIILCLFACTGNLEKATKQTFSNFVSLDEIDSAQIINNSGTFSLNVKQLTTLKKELEQLTLQPNEEIKVGAISLKFLIAKKAYFLATRTNGKLAELTLPNGKSMVFNLNGLNLDNYKNEVIVKTVQSNYLPVKTWIDDFKNFRMAIYNNDLQKLKTYFHFPFSDDGKTILHLCGLTEKDWLLRKRQFKNPELFYEADLAQYYKKVFDKRFTNAILKIKSEELFLQHKHSTKTFVEKELIYKMYSDYSEADKTLTLNMAFGNNYKDENGDYVSEGEHNIIYQFKIIDDKKLVLKRIDIAG